MRKQDTMTANEFQRLIRGLPPSAEPSGNRKVRNAVKVERDGVVFDSRLERHMFDLLTMHGIAFTMQKRYVLQEGFKYGPETIRPITYTVDFELSDYDVIIDTKGLRTQQGTMRVKMLKRLLADLGRTTRIELPRTKDECSVLASRIINNDYQ